MFFQELNFNSPPWRHRLAETTQTCRSNAKLFLTQKKTSDYAISPFFSPATEPIILELSQVAAGFM